MRLTLTTICILICSVFLMSCDDDSADFHAQDAQDHSSHSTLAMSENGLSELLLNKGRKWRMDDHTRLAFGKMEELFLKADYVSLEGDGLKKAASGLQIQIDSLIQGCTMTGDAHEQLHVYLMAYISAVDSLANSGRAEDAERVQYYLKKYVEYFE